MTLLCWIGSHLGMLITGFGLGHWVRSRRKPELLVSMRFIGYSGNKPTGRLLIGKPDQLTQN